MVCVRVLYLERYARPYRRVGADIKWHYCHSKVKSIYFHHGDIVRGRELESTAVEWL